MIVVVDNYDSFTFNLVQYLRELGSAVQVFRNDELSIAKIKDLKPDQIVISPGPGRPNTAGLSNQIIYHFFEEIPILGVCLGHQCLADVFGAGIVHAKAVMHGKTSLVYHDASKLFEGLSNPFEVMRYHSLVVDPLTLPESLVVSAWTESSAGQVDEVMALRHRSAPLMGVQFHPESIMTKVGHDLLKNFIRSS